MPDVSVALLGILFGTLLLLLQQPRMSMLLQESIPGADQTDECMCERSDVNE